MCPASESERLARIDRHSVASSTGNTHASEWSYSSGSSHASVTPRAQATSPTTLPVSASSVSSGPIALSKITARDVAERLIDLCYEHGDLLSNLKLQKLLYYTQAWYLALHNRPLFSERLEAWIHGPTQPDTYAHFSQYGSSPIDRPVSGIVLSAKAERHLRDVLKAYGSFSAFDLERLSQEERPWQEARANLPADEPSTPPIDTETMKQYYKARLDEQEETQG